MQDFLSSLSAHTPLTSEARLALQEACEQVSFGKNELLLREGQVCRHLYFVESGALRGFYTPADKEITHWFAFENDFVTSFHSFITGTAAIENISFLEPSVLLAISKDKLTTLFDRFHEIERLVRIVYEKYYIRLEERYVNAQFKSATERYERLLQESPHILSRVALGHVADYLNISRETLSRIRGSI